MDHYSFNTVINLFKLHLSDFYSENEIFQFIKMIFEHYLQFTSTDFILKRNEQQSVAFTKELLSILDHLKNGEPIQYILGYAWFRGIKLKVTPSVLIPRQETEELVEWIINDLDCNEPSVLDIGTGSGCIALALKNELPKSNVIAWDISNEALQVALQNANEYGLDIHFEQKDILNFSINDHPVQYDVIVSNPPYVMHKEKFKMHPNVLNNEPQLALFVDDNDPLLFYRAIVNTAKLLLNSNGLLYFEINESLGQETVQLIEKSGLSNIELKKDINGKDRMIKCVKV